jgi:ribonuclease HI
MGQNHENWLARQGQNHNKGWIQVKNTELFQEAAFVLRQRSATTAFQWVKGHK